LDWKHKKGNWCLHTNLTISIQSWALQLPEDVFFFQNVGEINEIRVPFTMDIQTPTQCESMLSYGHNGPFLWMPHLAQNDMKFHLFTLMGLMIIAWVSFLRGSL